jgi:hypothetical protein
MLFCFILLSLCVFFVLQVCGRKGDISGCSDLKSKKEEKMESEEAIVCRRSAIDRSAIECTKGDRTHLCMKLTPAAALFWKFLILGFWLILVAQGFDLTRFRVSRILLDSINRPVNIELNTRYFGEEFTTFKETIFRVYSFLLFYFMKMISINIMCN